MIGKLQIGKLEWFHIPYPNDENIEYLRENYDFHPLDLEDCQSKVQRPKIDIYDNYRFMILHFPYFDKAMKFVKTKEVKIFWGEHYIITLGSHWVIRTLFDKTKTEADIDIDELPNTSDVLLYSILDSLMRESFKLMKLIEDNLDHISMEMFDKKAEKTIERISVTRKNLILLNTAFKPQLRLFQKMESGVIKGFTPDMEDYWGNNLDSYQKMWDSIEDYQELIQGFSLTFDSLQANRTNEIMKVLTTISTILLPLTFLTGLYGMNVDLPLQENNVAFIIIVSTMILIVISLLFYFKKRRWI
ncbi:MAG: magnesium transporter CorA family protein [Bacteroidales bacterium]|nr:magnesium transporter CorA family protein [Bacteroidales bacterium]